MAADFTLKERIAQCTEMIKFLEIPCIDIYFDHQVLRCFPDGNIQYRWGNMQHARIDPTDRLINVLFERLKPMCLDRANDIVKKRMLDHQLKFSNLDFLVSN